MITRRGNAHYVSMRPAPESVNSDIMISLSRVRVVVLTILFSAIAGNLLAADKIKINVRQSDEAIRNQLLGLTPLGTSAEDVHKFLRFGLYADSSVPDALGGRFGPLIIVDLGHYYDLRTLWAYFFPFPTVVQAFWDFDEHEKLRDIRIQRLVHGL
jgi:hypothetical protein